MSAHTHEQFVTLNGDSSDGNLPEGGSGREPSSESTNESAESLEGSFRRIEDQKRNANKDTIPLSALNLIVLGDYYRAELTCETLTAWEDLDSNKTPPSDLLRGAATESNKEQSRGEVAKSAALRVRSDRKWAKGIRLAETVQAIVRPLMDAAERRADELQGLLGVSPEARTIRKGNWASLLEFGNAPAVVGIVFYTALMYLLIRSEITAMMSYVLLAFPDIMLLSIPGIDWLTPGKVAFGFTFSYIAGLFMIMKYLPFFADAATYFQHHQRFRRAVVLLCFIGPVTFAWVVGVKKEAADAGLEATANLTLLSPAMWWSPGMPAYILIAIFLVMCGTVVIFMSLKECVDSLYTFDRIEAPHPKHASDELGIIRLVLSSYRDVLQQATSVLDSAKAAQQSLALDYTFALQRDQADFAARKSQAYLDPSRN